MRRCVRGHDPDWYVDPDGKPRCRACQRERRRRERRAAAALRREPAIPPELGVLLVMKRLAGTPTPTVTGSAEAMARWRWEHPEWAA